jgi:hypothetical protein
MIGLMTIGPADAASVSRSADHSNHSSSSVKMSSSTLLSTSVAATRVSLG